MEDTTVADSHATFQMEIVIIIQKKMSKLRHIFCYSSLTTTVQ